MATEIRESTFVKKNKANKNWCSLLRVPDSGSMAVRDDSTSARDLWLAAVTGTAMSVRRWLEPRNRRRSKKPSVSVSPAVRFTDPPPIGQRRKTFAGTAPSFRWKIRAAINSTKLVLIRGYVQSAPVVLVLSSYSRSLILPDFNDLTFNWASKYILFFV